MRTEKLTCVSVAGMLPYGPERSPKCISMRKFGGWRSVCATFLLCVASAIALPAQTFKTLVTFDGTNGSQPLAFLVQGTDGYLYGTTNEGGVTGSTGPGTVFKITPGGTLTALYSFCSQSNCTDGAYPVAEMVQATNGEFYGTTSQGGANGAGEVFKITSGGKLVNLYSFCAQTNCADGAYPGAGLTQAPNGEFYGTTVYGGANDAGTVFKITPGGKLTTLHTSTELTAPPLPRGWFKPLMANSTAPPCMAEPIMMARFSKSPERER